MMLRSFALPLLLAMSSQSLAHEAGESRTGPSDHREEEISYEFIPCMSERPCLDIRLIFRASNDIKTAVGLADGWGGASNPTHSIISMSATGEGGRMRDVAADPHAGGWNIAHAPGEVLTVTYRLSPPYFEESESVRFHRGLVENSRIHVFSPTGLLLPRHWRHDQEVRVHVIWDELAWSGWVVAPSSFSNRPMTLGELSNISVTALKSGTLFERHLADGSMLRIVADAELADGITALVPELVRVLGRQRSLFPDLTYPEEIVVSALAYGEGNSLKGNGVENGIVLAIGAHYDLQRRMHLRWLGGHELLHLVLRPEIANVGDEHELYWYSEGFNNYINRSILLDTGLMRIDEYVEHINQVLETLASSPSRNAPNKTIARSFWATPDVKNLPYLRGDIAALLIDSRLRLNAKGRVWNLAETWVTSARDAEQSVGAIFTSIARNTSSEVSAEIARFIEEGGDLRLPTDVLAPCLTLRDAPTYRYDIGFDPEASERTHVVSGVRPASEAYKAGLRNGLGLIAIQSEQPGASSTHVRVITRDANDERAFTFLPRVSTGETHQQFSINDPDA